MTLEATVTKLMWILGQTKEPEQVKEMFYQTVGHDILWKAVTKIKNSLPDLQIPARNDRGLFNISN